MNIFDTDRSGSINFMEFEGLYRYIQVGLQTTPLTPGLARDLQAL